jgi:membrane protease YdiL (CAAX protease family)
MYRGFGIEELALLTGHRWLAGSLSLVFFTLAHAGLYGFSAALAIPGLTGAVLTLLYLWRRNLWSCILMHLLIDGLFFVLVPALMATSGK